MTASADHELLRIFCRMRDELAFAELLQRHAPMVRDVCRRLLSRESETDDAVQAVFLVLARRAGTIRKGESLPSWLYGVAYRVCQRTRRDAARRKKRETRAAKPIECDPAKEATWRELCATLDAELIRLPEKYRAPLIHCYLQGLTHDQAALELGLSVRTLNRRLEHGRALLRGRLERQGLTLSATLLIVALSQRSAGAAWAVPLFQATLRAALKIAAGAPLAVDEISLGAARLMESILRSIFLTQLKFVAVVVFAVAATTGAARMVLVTDQPGKAPNAPAQASTKTTVPQEHGAGLKRTDLLGDPLPPGAMARLGSVRWRLQGALADCMRVTPDGKHLVTADPKTGVAWWTMADGVVRERIPAVPDQRAWFPAQAIALSGDGRRAAIADSRSTIHILDLPSGAEIANRKYDAPVPELALSGNGALLASRTKDGVLFLWEIGQGQGASPGTLPLRREPWQVGLKPAQRRQFAAQGPHYPQDEQLAFSPDGKLFAWVGLEEGMPVHLYDATRRQELTTLGNYKGIERFITFSPDGSKLASLSAESLGEVWDIATRKVVFTMPKGWADLPPVAVFSPDSKAVALKVPADSIYVLEIPSRRQRWQVKSNTVSTNRRDVLAFTPDGRTLLINPHDPVVYRYDAANGQRLLQAEEESGNFFELAFSHDGKSVYSLGADSTLRQWEAATGKQRRKLPVASSYGEFSPDGRLTAMTYGGGAHVYDTETGNERWRSPENQVHCFSNDGNLLALSAGADLVLRHSATGKELQRMHGAATVVFRAAISPDNRRLYVNDVKDYQPGRLHVWDIGSGRELRSFALSPNGGFFSLSPDGRMFALQHGPDSKEGGCLELWEILTGQRRLVSERPDQYTFPARLGFTPNGNYVVTPDFENGDLKFHEVGTFKIHHRLSGYPNGIYSWTFTHNGARLATARTDMTALVWDLTATPAQKSRPIQSALAPASLWNDLASTDAAKAYQAVRAMIYASQRTLPYLAEHLGPVAPVDEKQITTWISQLGNDRFATRQQASRELERCGDAARPFLERADESKLSPEAAQRVRQLLTKPSSSPELVRALRAVEVLEHIDTPEARCILQRLAQGQRGAMLTEEATAALNRLR
jgi:RNA polymerase sigma factor (sigma-70 family)